jgi:hypothetical protein
VQPVTEMAHPLPSVVLNLEKVLNWKMVGRSWQVLRFCRARGAGQAESGMGRQAMQLTECGRGEQATWVTEGGGNGWPCGSRGWRRQATVWQNVAGLSGPCQQQRVQERQATWQQRVKREVGHMAAESTNVWQATRVTEDGGDGWWRGRWG